MKYNGREVIEMPKNERALPDGFMTVGKLAERMGVTVRTLQYYDREGTAFSHGRKAEAGEDCTRIRI